MCSLPTVCVLVCQQCILRIQFIRRRLWWNWLVLICFVQLENNDLVMAARNMQLQLPHSMITSKYYADLTDPFFVDSWKNMIGK